MHSICARIQCTVPTLQSIRSHPHKVDTEHACLRLFELLARHSPALFREAEVKPGQLELEERASRGRGHTLMLRLERRAPGLSVRERGHNLCGEGTGVVEHGLGRGRGCGEGRRGLSDGGCQ
jgi:hypothetical protein